MSEGDVQPPQGAKVPEAHELDYVHVPKAFHAYVLPCCLCKAS